MSIDLHLHTSASDGVHSPPELLDIIKKSSLNTIAFADHESVEGTREVYAISQQAGIELIPAVELLVDYHGYEVHLLGYGVDIFDQDFLDLLSSLRQRRNEVALSTVQNLQHLGFPLNWEAVKAIAHPRGAVSKGHIIHAMHHNGLLSGSDPRQFMREYLDPQGLAHVRWEHLSFEQAQRAILKAGGYPVIAHPALIRNKEVVVQLLKNQPLGMEVFYCYYGPFRKQWLEEYYSLAKNADVLITGGSDYHGPFAPFKLGDLVVPDWVVSQLKEAINHTQKIYNYMPKGTMRKG